MPRVKGIFRAHGGERGTACGARRTLLRTNRFFRARANAPRYYACDAAQASIWADGMAPLVRANSLPDLKRIMVGMPRMP